VDNSQATLSAETNIWQPWAGRRSW